MRIDSRSRFSEVADDYARYRPGYPAAAIDWILGATGAKRGATAVDIGCGTGILSRLLAARGLDVIGIEPNEAMLAHAQKAGGANYLRGDSSATGLPDASADLAVAGQAFHWFDLDRTSAELGRILRPPRRAVALWNVRADGPQMDAYEQLLLEYSAEYRTLFGGDFRITMRAHPGFLDTEEAEFAYTERLAWDRFWGRCRSSSYVVHGVERKAELEAAMRRLFDRFADGETLPWPSRTELIAFTVKAFSVSGA